MKRIKHFVKTRKILSSVIAIAIIIIVYLLISKVFSAGTATSYVFAKAKIANITTSVSGTGQISALNQVDIKSKASGDIVFLNTTLNGTEIKKGTLIAQIDTTDAQISLESARIAYAKLVKQADEATIMQAESNLTDAITNNKKAYDDAFNSITDTFIDLPTVINGLYTMFYDASGYLQSENVRPIGLTALDYQTKAGMSYDKAKAKYENLLSQYKNLSRNSATSSIESFVYDTYLLVKDVSETLKNSQNTIDFMISQRSTTAGTSAASNVSAWTNTINTDLTNLLSAKNNITSTGQAITQKTIDLKDIENGPDELDIASQRLNLRQAENTYADYFIRAPFDGLLAKLSVKSTDTVSNGTVIGTLVSSQKIATITLNEVDVAKVKVGQKAKLTFDAIDGLSLDGTVTTVDLVGTVSQGVVNYSVEITLDGLDDRIKSGMSVSASIITEIKENVLTVPNSAIKTQGNINYVEVFNISSTTPPLQKRVETGMTDDTITEIVSGINEGERVVIKTITGTVTKATTPTIFSAAGANSRGSTGNVRIPRN